MPTETAASVAAFPENHQCSATIGQPPGPDLHRADARIQVPEEHFEREKPYLVSQVDTSAVDRLSEPSVGIERPRGQRANENPSPCIPTRPCCIRHTRRKRPNQAGWSGFHCGLVAGITRKNPARKPPWTTRGQGIPPITQRDWQHHRKEVSSPTRFQSSSPADQCREKNSRNTGKDRAARPPGRHQKQTFFAFQPDFSDGFDRYNLHEPPLSGRGTTMQRQRRCSEYA